MVEENLRDHERKYQRRKRNRRKSDKIINWAYNLIPVGLAIIVGIIALIEWRSSQTQQIKNLSSQIERNRANIKENRQNYNNCNTKIANIEGRISSLCKK